MNIQRSEHIHELADERNELLTENTRLRAALIAIDNPLLELLSCAEDGEMPPQSAWAAASEAYKALRTALEEKR